MTNWNDHKVLILMAALFAGCSGAGGGGENGGLGAGADDPAVEDPSSDDDGDGVPAARDRCSGTTDEATWTDVEGCAENEDGDGDGIPTDQDLCPGTGSGENVDDAGCSQAQIEEQEQGESGAGTSKPAEEWEPTDDGSVAPNGFATFVLDPQGALPVVIKTLAKNVTPIEGGFELDGTLLIPVPGGHQIKLLEAHVKLEYDSQKGEGLQSFSGTARLPFPNIGFMSDVSVDDLVYASVGWDYGKNIPNVDAPLKPERKYLYFTFSAGLSAKIGELAVSIGDGQSVTMTLDPSDPAFVVKAALGGLMGPVDEASVGFSIGGHLPFTPENTWGIDVSKASFDGHLWTGGRVNLNAVKLPLAIGGNTVYDLDPNDDGLTVFQDPNDGVQFGANSSLDLSVDLKVASLEIPIAQATIVGRVGGSEAWAMYSGSIKSGMFWMPDVVPVRNSAELKVAGYVSSDITKSYFEAQGDVALDAGKLGEWTGLDLDDLAMARAKLAIDQKGVLVEGVASTSISPVIGLKGDVLAKAFFNAEPSDWYVTLDGNLAVSGIDLSAQAHARLDYQGMYVNGLFETPLSSVSMSGWITQAGIDIQGQAEVEIPIIAGKEIVQWVTDKAVCGAELVADATLCGVKTVEDGAKCGYSTVTSAAECGYDTVTSAAKCGESYVTSGAVCGYTTVTSAAQCGVETLEGVAKCGWDCVSSGFSKCTCKKPKTCKVANSCKIPNTCKVEASCDIPNTCDVPDICEKVNTCQTKLTIPDYDYGSFKGSVTVKIGTSGLHGTVNGQYCDTSGACTTIANGKLSLSSGKPEACVTLAGLGEFCAPF